MEPCDWLAGLRAPGGGSKLESTLGCCCSIQSNPPPSLTWPPRPRPEKMVVSPFCAGTRRRGRVLESFNSARSSGLLSDRRAEHRETGEPQGTAPSPASPVRTQRSPGLLWQEGEEEEGQGKDEAGLSPQGSLGLRGEGGQVTEEALVRRVTSPRRHSACSWRP